MERIQRTIQTLLEIAGLNEPVVDVDQEGSRVMVFINEGPWFQEWTARLVADLGHVACMIGRKDGIASMIYVDVNNYRKERERLIIEIAKAAARKVLMTKNEVMLPAMNAYERRLVHTELAIRPDVKTESVGERKDRCVVVKPLL